MVKKVENKQRKRRRREMKMLWLDSVVKVRSPVKKKQITEKIRASIYYLVLLSFLIPIGFLVYRIITLDGSERAVGFHSRADYVLMLAQCVLGLIVIHIPSALARRLRFEIPGFLYTMYIIFLYCGIFLGEVRSFYYVVPHWDDFLHASSSMMTGFFAVMVITILNWDDMKTMQQKHGKKYKSATADAGYERFNNYLYLEANGQLSFIKPANYEQQKSSSFKKQIGCMENMSYDAEEDSNTCAQGRKLSLRRECTELRVRNLSASMPFDPGGGRLRTD